MIELARKIYVFIAILSPWMFLILRMAGFYNFIGKNTYIFLGLFLVSLLTMLFVCDVKE